MISALVLAAGSARRMGRPKLLLPVEGRPLVRWTVEQVSAAGVESILVVLGRQTSEVREALAGLPVDFVENPRHTEGMGTSIAAGAAALRPEATGALVVLGDQPIPPPIIDRLVRAQRASGLSIAAPSYRGVHGNPVLFAAAHFAELRKLDGDRGARGIVERHAAGVLVVPIPHPPPPDIDTEADYARHAPTLARGLQRLPGSDDEFTSQGYE